MEKEAKKKSNWLLWVLLVVFPPIGIPYMWIAKKEFSSSKKKILSAVSAIWFVIVMVFGGQDTEPSVTSNDTSVVLKDDNEKDKPATRTNANRSANQPAESDTTTEDVAQVTDKSDFSNILISATVQTADVMNGTKDSKIGTRAYIEISKDDLKSVTDKEYIEFSEDVVGDSEYNWFSIICDDGTGICYAGCIIVNAEYGELDSDGCITSVAGYISIKDGKCTYEEKTDDVSLEESSDASAKSDASSDNNNFNTYDNDEQQQTTETYVLNTNTRKFHYPSCRSVPRIAPQNYSTSSNTRDELIAQGYDPCGICNP